MKLTGMDSPRNSTAIHTPDRHQVEEVDHIAEVSEGVEELRVGGTSRNSAGERANRTSDRASDGHHGVLVRISGQLLGRYDGAHEGDHHHRRKGNPVVTERNGMAGLVDENQTHHAHGVRPPEDEAARSEATS